MVHLCGYTMRLTKRQESILKTIVERYIATAHPVGSAAVRSMSGLDVSSATIRNEMAALEDLDYIHQLHTSGGRVPTNAGYRYYVEHLMEPRQVSTRDARTIEHQFHEAHHELQEWLRLAATVLASRIRNVGLITPPRAIEARLHHLELIAIQSSVVLVLAVLHDGTVLQEMLALPETRTQEDLGALAARLTRDLKGMAANQIQARAGMYPAAETRLLDMVAGLLRRNTGMHTQVYHAGLAEMIGQPEFMELRHGESLTDMNERIRLMVDFLHQGFAVDRLLSHLEGEGDVQIVIGGEPAAGNLHDYSFVLGRYVGKDDNAGYLGVIGPTRMEYRQAVGIVRYMTHLMTDLTHSY